MRRILVIGLFAAVLVTACEDKTTDPLPLEPTGEIYGEVWHRLFPEQPLAGASLSWGDQDTVTDEQGRFFLQELEAGADSLRLDLDGYRTESRWIEVGDESLHESFTLMPLDTLPPDAPLDFQVETLDGLYLRLSWQAPLDETCTGFVLWKSPGDPSFTHLPLDSLAFDDRQVAPLRLYSYRLQCRDAYGNLSDALELSCTVDTYPTPAELTRGEGSNFESIPLIWTGNTDPDFAQFRLYRALGSSADSTDLLVYDGLDNSYLDEDVETNLAYAYRLYSCDESGQASVSNTVQAAAQIFIRDFGETNQLLALPGRGSFLAAGRNSGLLRILDAEGLLSDSLLAGYGSASWKLSEDEQSLLGYGYSQASVERVSLSPLALDGGALFDGGTYSAVAELGGDSLALTLWTGGTPNLVDQGSWESIGQLDILEDMSAQGLLAADPQRRKLWATHGGTEPHLYAVDLVTEPLILADQDRDHAPLGMWRWEDGSLLLADANPARMQWLDGEDLSLLDETVFSVASADRVVLDVGQSTVWLMHFSTNSLSAHDLEDGHTLIEIPLTSLPLSLAPLSDDGRVAVALSDGYIVLCQYPLP